MVPLLSGGRDVSVIQIVFIIVGVIVLGVLCFLNTEWADNDIDVLFVWIRNVLYDGFAVAFIVWIIKAIKTHRIFEVDFSVGTLIGISLILLLNLLTSKLFHKQFSRERRKWYLSDPRVPVYANRLPLVAVLAIFGTPIFLIFTFGI